MSKDTDTPLAASTGKRIQTSHGQGKISSASNAEVTGGYSIRTSVGPAQLRFRFDVNDAARQRENVLRNRGPAKVSTDTK